ncbi:sperm-associated antigen 6 [Cyclospora cayetanensis]|uniref:Sperm-associated antigen 6 n=1 Tax=Cyclospora cayetanensis TaxID=88456 RepID=A0A6P6RZL1_9EIME|nr:sperm-associated antigen 6 [Cyclospora cayetanensis]
MNRSVSQVFEEFQRARSHFVQTLADLSQKPQNIDGLRSAGALQLLRPLLLDSIPGIQQTAAVALGRLAGHSEVAARECVNEDILPHLVASVAEQNRFYRRSTALVMRSIAKHSAELSQAVIDCGALPALSQCLEAFDPQVKDAAASAIGCIARHSETLASSVVAAGIVPLLVLCIQEPEINIKRSAALALGDIAKHSPELAQVVCDAGAVPLLSKQLTSTDTVVRRQICWCLSRIALHSVDFAEAVVEADALPKLLHCLKDPDELVRRNAAACVREIVKHTPQLATFAANAGAIAALVDLIQETTGPTRVAGILALGYIGAFTETLALAIIVQKGIPPLKNALETESEDHAKAAAAWAVGQLGRHTPDHAMAVAEADVLRLLMAAFLAPDSSDDLKQKAKRALKGTVQMCTHLAALEPLLNEAPPSILKHIVQQFAKVLPNDPKARRTFVQTGALETLLKIRETEAASNVLDSIQSVCDLYPPEVVNYYSPGYSALLIEKIDAHS